MADPKLTDKQRLYIAGIARGMTSFDAALAAGYSKSYAKVSAHRLGRKQAVANAITQIQKKGREMAAYTVVEAMAEADAAAEFAILQKVPMALVRARDLKARLAGLLIEKVELVTVDLSSALSRAEQRVLNITSATSTMPSSLIAWRGPHIPGDPEGGSANGQAGT